MAPRGPRGQAPSGRETRSSAMKSKPTTRGGIQKRRGGPTRVDNDGDLDMDAAARRAKKSTPTEPSAARSRPATRSSAVLNPKAASRTAQTVLKHLTNGGPSNLASRISNAASGKGPKSRAQDSTGLTFLRVRGLKESKAASNPGGGLNDLLGFLERKSASLMTGKKRSIRIKKSHMVGDFVFIGASKEDAEELLKVNTFTFAGAQLEVIESPDGPGNALESKDTQELRTRLQSILSQRYLGANKLLKLDALAADTELVTLGMFETRERALKTFKGLMAICDTLFKTEKEKEEAIESISLANNNIDDVAQVEVVATTFPRLKHLDMSGNQITMMQGLDRWKGKFKWLETIFLSANPIETTDPNYTTSLLEWFPKLQVINGNQLRTPEQIAEIEAALKPKAIPQNGPDFRDVGGIGENFLLEFFAAYDSDRQSLASKFYDDKSQFSLAVDNRSLRNVDAPAPIPWSSYIRLSRNLTKINHQNARVQRLFKGASVIYDVWKSLPFTRHPDIKQEISKYIMDCHPLPGLVDPNGQNTIGVDGLIIAVHGEFEEHDQGTGTTGKRSFSRTFILGPGQPGKGPIRVVSDILSLRAYSPLPNVFAAPTHPPPEQNHQQAMIAELSKQTGMTPQYSEMCLVQVNWEFDKALVIFNEKKAQLPPEAFATTAPQ
ncbi:Fc.00g065390.m01.CDS01 [Cosmosporella sp. VM-42]